MPLPSEAVPVSFASSSNVAFVLRLPEDVLSELDGDLSVTVSGSDITLNLPSRTLPLDSNPTQPLEILRLSPNNLTHLSTSTSRLSIPLSAYGAGAAERLKRQSDALDRERKERAERVTGQRPAKRGDESPAPSVVRSKPVSNGQPVKPPSTGPQPQGIPLKTRVLQLLALGPITMSDVVRRVGGAEEDVARVVRVYTLAPGQYSKVKIASWSYTRAEKETVIRLARAAFDELGLEQDAEERKELIAKEAEAFGSSGSGGGSVDESASSSPSNEKVNGHDSLQPPPVAVMPGSPPVGSNSVGKSKSASKSRQGDKDKTKVGKQIAKFRAEHVKRNSSLTRSDRIDTDVESKEGKGINAEATKQVETIVKTDKDKIEKSIVNQQSNEESTSSKSKSESKDLKTDSKGKSTDKPVSTSGEKPSNKPLSKSTEAGSSSQQSFKVKGETSKETERSDRDRERDREKGRNRDKERDKVNSKRKCEEGEERGSREGPSEDKRDRDRIKESRKDRDTDKGSRRDKHRRLSPVYTSSEASSSSDDEGSRRGRTREKRAVPSTGLDGHSSSNSGTNGNGKSTSTKNIDDSIAIRDTVSTGATSMRVRKEEEKNESIPDPEMLRERYEELFPAYEQLTAKLVALHSAAESTKGGGGSAFGYGSGGEINVEMVREEEIRKLVGRWEKWHKELEGIRRWFSE